MTTGDVLVVDDEPSVVTTIKAILELDGLRVAAATNGSDAIRLIHEREFDVVLTDLRLGDIDGIEVMREVQRTWPDTLSIMLTGYSSLDTAVAALRSGAYDYLVKPSDVDELRATIARAIERRQLRRRLVQLEELDRMKSEFLSLASHELRTPLTAVRGFVQVALRRVQRQAAAADLPDVWREESAKLVDTLRTVDRQAGRLGRLIDELLDVTRAGANRLELRLANTDLAELARDVVGRTQLLTQTHPIRADTGDAVTVRGDRDRLEQVLENLVANALKYSPEGSPVVVTVRQEAGEAHLEVRDRGIGIDPGELESVFTLFYRSSKTEAREASGLGIGLYISRELVNRHAGRLWAESRPGEGTQVHMTLPLAGRDGSAETPVPVALRAP